MIQAVVTPQNTKFKMSVTLPRNYVGKEVNVLFYIDEEVKQTSASVTSKKKPADFIGIFNEEEAENFDKHIQQMRSEWNRNI
jgi:hypothetical protein